MNSGIQQAFHTLSLFLGRENGDVVLEWVRNPSVVKADIGYTLMFVPVVFLRKSLEDNIIKVLVV